MYLNQSLNLCQRCGHAQLDKFIDNTELYNNRYSFKTSRSMNRAGNLKFLKFILNQIKDKELDTIIEIGCNDLFLLEHLKDKANNIIGIDPILNDGVENGIKKIGKFVEEVDLSSLIDGKTLIITSHFLEHLDNPRNLFEILSKLKDVLLIFSFPLFNILLEQKRFDQIYHHHKQYFSFSSISYLLNKFNYNLIEVDYNYSYWGTIMIAFDKEINSRPIQSSIKISKSDIITAYKKFKKSARHVTKIWNNLNSDTSYLYGASLQLPVLLYHFEINLEYCKGIIDDNEYKIGKFYPNLDLEIISKKNASLHDSNVFISAPTFGREIMNKLEIYKPKNIVCPFLTE